MKHHLVLVCLAAMALGACATSTQRDLGLSGGKEREIPIPHEVLPHIRKAEAIGRQLYVLDKVSAIATDELVKRVPDFRKKGLAGYLPAREADDELRLKDSFMVAFFTREDPPRIAYAVRITPNSAPELEVFDPPKAGTGSFVGLVQARQAAIAALPAVTQPMNPVLLPGTANDEKGILVYMIAGTTKPNVAVFGQHFRVLMPEGGGSPTYVMPLSKSTLEVPTRGPNGERREALEVSHLVTDWPLETHVFMSLLMRMPVYVGTRRGIWRVDGDRIALISDQIPERLR